MPDPFPSPVNKPDATLARPVFPLAGRLPGTPFRHGEMRTMSRLWVHEGPVCAAEERDFGPHRLWELIDQQRTGKAGPG